MVDERKVPEGYKVTEVGVIPEDWDEIYLSKALLGSPKYGINAAAVDYSESLPTYLRITDISDDGRFIRSKKVSVDNESSENYYLEENDLVFARTGASTGKTYLYDSNDGKLVYAGFLIKVSVDQKIMDPRFLKSYTQTETYWNWVRVMSMRSGQPGINGSEYSKLKLPLPPLSEQKAIAEALSDTDSLIQSVEKLIDKKNKIKHGAMQQLLTGKKRLPGFSGEWEVKRLGEIGEFSGAGIDKKINADEEKVRLLNFLDVYHKDFIYSNDLWHEVTAPKYKAEKCSIKRGDVFFTPSSELRTDIALSAVAMEDIDDAVYSYHVVRYRFYDEWDIHFKTYIFNTRFFFSQAETMCEGSGKRYVISLKKFKELEIMYPIDLREQKAIAQVLSDMDAEIEALEEKLEKYKTIKQGMMQELLTGRIRLI